MLKRIKHLPLAAAILGVTVALLACRQVEEPTSAAIADLSAEGRLVVQGQDNNIYVLEHGQPLQAMTRDAGPNNSQTMPTVRYSDPTWSPSGWLSYVRTTADADSQQSIEVIVRPPGGTDPVTVLSSNSQDSYIYGFWSPSACASGLECNQFAYLMDDNDGIALHLAQVSSDAVQVADDVILGRSAPFFYSWSPDGQSMLWFIDQQELVVYDVVRHQATDLPDVAGRFLAPAWSPTDQRLLIARNDGMSDRQLKESHITIIDDADRIDIGESSDTPIFFEWSPDASRIAWTTGGDPLDPVTITAVDDPSLPVVTPVQNVVAFFWSPDSTKLAVVALEPIGDDPADMANPLSVIFTWWAVDASTGHAVKLARFFPTPEQFDIFRDFDQFFQSHRVWSPDSRYIVFADLPERGSRTLPGTIRLADTEHPEDEPIMLMEGRQAVFSFQ